jgi:hypothetical protein
MDQFSDNQQSSTPAPGARVILSTETVADSGINYGQGTSINTPAVLYFVGALVLIIVAVIAIMQLWVKSKNQ